METAEIKKVVRLLLYGVELNLGISSFSLAR